MKSYAIIAMALLVLSVMPMVMATSVGTGVGVSITTEQFTPRIWMCDNRVFEDDFIQNTEKAQKRANNYAFEGESIKWTVLVMDKNKIEEITDVVGTIGPSQGVGNDVEVECTRVTSTVKGTPAGNCNARILEENLTTFKSETMAYYDCELTVETPASMHGEYFITIEAMDSTGLSATMDENEYWFLNPTIALSVEGDLEFEDVRPGTQAYSQTLLLGNDAEAGSGVVLDMFMSGTDFYDPSSSGARCSDNTNKLALEEFKYFATNGQYSTAKTAITGKDDENYAPIPLGTAINQAREIIGNQTFANPMVKITPGNTLTPGAEMALTFKLTMPEPCVGDFSEGQIYFWGEAI
ncbi:MAG: hypothetical protein KKE50_03720 [Nanoarchaeota archaeon]|nr:hypothetical protein [Nanoarchaeota archaeon]